MADVDVLDIPERDGLDAITVYWRNIEPGKGYVTITCWGGAWTTWFGGMGGKTIQQFFSEVGADYLIPKFVFTQWQKSNKKHEEYLKRIIKAIQAELRKDG